MPAVLGLGTPWADLTETGDTMFTNEDIDQVLVHYDGVLGAAARLYAGDHDLADPPLSPVNGDFAGFPPTILIAGTRDMLLMPRYASIASCELPASTPNCTSSRGCPTGSIWPCPTLRNRERPLPRSPAFLVPGSGQ